MSDLTEAIRQFDATEANLKRLEELWKELEALIPREMVLDIGSPDALRYGRLRRTFGHICKALPKIDGLELTDETQELDAIFMSRLDAKECGELSAEISTERSIYSQGELLHEYRFRFSVQRRLLVRSAITTAIAAVDSELATMANRDFGKPVEQMTGEHWENLKKLIAELDVLKGTTVKLPTRWRELQRHMAFGFTSDLYDIIHNDWPAAKEFLRSAIYGPDDPVPVDTADLAALVSAAPKGRVVTALNWEGIDDEGFERLLYNIVSDTPGYSNAQWLMHTRAADRGRDISVTKTVDDPLSGSRVLRVIVQCKHWQSKGIGMSEVTTLVNQMSLWEPPLIDELVIATSGRFSADAVGWIEKHSHNRNLPVIYMWPESHLESLLAARPHLVALFGLR